ncbi:MAG: diacylglycerol kinase [Proteobacteria bacterium]|nr:MAG: diacylglycerol kinase [Pseudomonadota bacterium]
MKNQGFKKRFTFAQNGIKHAFKTEQSFRTQLCFAIAAYVSLGLLGATPLWWAAVTLCISLVLTAELFNTALEQFIDHIHPAEHRLIGIAKDCAAGAVLVSSLLSVVIFGYYLVDRFG